MIDYPSVGVDYVKYDPEPNVYYDVQPWSYYVSARVKVDLSRGNDEWSVYVDFKEEGI
ncbi:hypothetical protein [Desulfitibacter alkalitolerans]|uniref:hypothetical protein n=1 Tax=Desulfitibacter alkalitolerans TaxID=264641 RepID=UPI0012EBDCDC|nr:hypothetical protein [Desulfitibacter alkalitolerans]